MSSSHHLSTPQKPLSSLNSHLTPSNNSNANSPFKRSPSNASSFTPSSSAANGVGIPEQAFLNARLPAAAAAAASSSWSPAKGTGSRGWTPKKLSNDAGADGGGRGSWARDRVEEEEEGPARPGGRIELAEPLSPFSATSFLNIGADDLPREGDNRVETHSSTSGRFDDPPDPSPPKMSNPFPPANTTPIRSQSQVAGTSTAIYHPFDSPSSPQSSSQPVSPTSPSYQNQNYSLPHGSRRKPPPSAIDHLKTSQLLRDLNDPEGADDSQDSSPHIEYIPSAHDRLREDRELSLHKEGELHETQDQHARSRRSTFGEGEEGFEKEGRYDSTVEVDTVGGGNMNMTSTDRLVGGGLFGGMGGAGDSEVVGLRGRFPTRGASLEWNRGIQAGQSQSGSRSRNRSTIGDGEGSAPDSPGTGSDPFATFSGRVGDGSIASRGLRKDTYAPPLPHQYPPVPKVDPSQLEKAQPAAKRKSLLDLQAFKRHSGSDGSRPFMNFESRHSVSHSHGHSNGHNHDHDHSPHLPPHNNEQLSQVYPSASQTTSILPPTSQPYLRRTSQRKSTRLNSQPLQSTHYFFKGKLITGGDTIIPFLISVVMVLGLTGLWLGTTGAWIWRDGLGGGGEGGGGVNVGGKVAVIVFGYLMGVCFGAMMATAFRDPGIIPRNLDPTFPISHTASTGSLIPLTRELRVKGGSVNVKYCETCRIYRPPRSSHCRLCGNCVEGIDHHCSYLHNCVGKRNYTSFITFLITAVLAIIYTITFSALHYTILTSRERISFATALKRQPGSGVSFVVGVVVVWPMGALLGYHLRLMFLHSTTIEQIRKSASRSLLSSATSPARDRHTNPFSHHSLLKNFFHSLCRPQGPSWVDASGWEVRDERLRNPGTYGEGGG